MSLNRYLKNFSILFTLQLLVYVGIECDCVISSELITEGMSLDLLSVCTAAVTKLKLCTTYSVCLSRAAGFFIMDLYADK